MKKDMPLEGLRWSRDSGSALYDTPPNGRSRTGWGGIGIFTSWKELLTMSERVSSRVGESIIPGARK